KGKTPKAGRNVPLTFRVRDMLRTRRPGALRSKCSPTRMHGHSADFARSPTQETEAGVENERGVCATLSETHLWYGTRSGEAGADVFTIMRLMGHSSVTISQRYVHPTPESLERAVERLEALNAKWASGEEQPATVSATLPNVVSRK